MWDRFFHLALHLGWFLQQSCDALGGSTQEEFHVSSTACSQHTSIYTALTSLKTEHLNTGGLALILKTSFVTRTCWPGGDNKLVI